MKKMILTFVVAASFCLLTQATSVEAQCASCGAAAAASTGEIVDCGPGGCGSRLRGLGSGQHCPTLNTAFNGGVDNSVRDADGMIQPTTTRHLHFKETLKYGVQDHFSPRRFYPYTNAGLDAGHTHAWTQQQAAATPWHGSHSHWRFGTPTALVVPANSSYGSNYAWGVGQTTSTPLYHQFGQGYGGVAYGPGFGAYPSVPYYPSSTNQFGVYSVRATW